MPGADQSSSRIKDLVAAGGEIWAALQEALGRLGSKTKSVMAAGLVAYPFGLVLGAVGIVRPDVKRVAARIAEPGVAVRINNRRSTHVDSRVVQPGASFESMIYGCRCWWLMSVSFDRRSVLRETFCGPGLRLERAGWFFARISWELPCGSAWVPAKFLRGFFVAELASRDSGWFLIRIYWRALCGLYKACCPSRRGPSQFVLRGTPGLLSCGLWCARADSQALMALRPFSFSS